MVRRQFLDFNCAWHHSDVRGVAQGSSVLQLCGDEASALYTAVHERHSWFVRGPQRGSNGLDDSFLETLGFQKPSIVQIQKPLRSQGGS